VSNPIKKPFVSIKLINLAFAYHSSKKDKLFFMKVFRGFLLCVILVLFSNVGSAQEREFQGTKLNVPMKAEKGEVVAVSNEGTKQLQVKITESFEAKKGFLKFQYQEGVIYPLRSLKDGYDLYYDNKKLTQGKYWGVGINEDDPEDVIAVIVSPEGDLVRLKKYKLNDRIVMTESFQKCSDCYTQELRFAGMQGKELLFTYRELIGVLNKVRFEDEFTFSFEQNQMIDYKGLNIKMLKASNASLEYEVLELFESLR